MKSLLILRVESVFSVLLTEQHWLRLRILLHAPAPGSFSTDCFLSFLPGKFSGWREPQLFKPKIADGGALNFRLQKCFWNQRLKKSIKQQAVKLTHDIRTSGIAARPGSRTTGGGWSPSPRRSPCPSPRLGSRNTQ